jgi:hypothetical protein
MTRARLALGEGPGEPVWEQRPGLATSYPARRESACAVINIYEGRGQQGFVDHAPPLLVDGEERTG